MAAGMLVWLSHFWANVSSLVCGVRWRSVRAVPGNCLLANRVSRTGAFGWRTKLSQEIGKYMNIMDVVRSTLGGGTTMSAISSQLGLGQDQTQRATSATIPTLLAGLTHVASTPHGAEQLSDAISRQDPGMVDNISNTLS